VNGPALFAPVTVAIVSWNTRERLAACLRALTAEHERGIVAVWVVDNGSSDGSCELVRDEFPWVTLVESETNIGFGAAVNLVATRTTSPWLLPANADVEITPGALDALLEAGARDARAGALAPRLILDDGGTQHSVYPFPTLPCALLVNLGLARPMPWLGERFCLEGFWNPERPRAVDWAIAAFVLVRREAWESVGGFDERHWIYAEDLDLGWRLARNGWTTRYEPAAVVHHAGGAATSQAFGDERRARFMAETYAWMARERGMPRTLLTAAVNSLGAAVRVALFAPLAVPLKRFRAPRDAARGWLRAHRQGLHTGRVIPRPG